MSNLRKKVAVTGGLGFIGSYLVEQLLLSGHDVAILDIAEPTDSRDDQSAQHIRLDLLHKGEVLEVLNDLSSRGFRSLIHLAGNSDALRSISEPTYDFAANAEATAVVLTAAAQTGWDRAVIASSALVYGRDGSKFRSENEPPDPIFPYSASKLASEAFASALTRWSNLEVIVARLFTVYDFSLNLRESLSEPVQYASRARHNQTITALGDLDKKIRDFVHVLDVVDALRILLDKGKAGTIYNVGTGAATSLRELLRHIETSLGRPINWETDCTNLHDSYRIVPNIDRISRLGFRPGINLPEALDVMLADTGSLSPQIHPPLRPAMAKPAVRRQTDSNLRELADADWHSLRQIVLPMSNAQAATFEVGQVARVLRGAKAQVDSYQPPRVDRVAVFLPPNIVAYSYALFALVPSLFARRVQIRASRIAAQHSGEIHRVLRAYAASEVELCQMSQSEYLEHTRGSDVVVFTGRFENAIEVARQYPESLFLYFGSGVNPFVVGPEATDLQGAVDLAIRSRVFNSGQDCLCPDVLLVHEGLAEEFVSRLVDEVGLLRLGAPDDPGADYCPLFYPGVAGQVRRLLASRREQVVHRGVVSEREQIVDPVVLVGDITAPYQVHENFAPVFDVRIYRDDAQVRNWVEAPARKELALGATALGAGPLASYLRRRHTVAEDLSLFDIDDVNAPFGGYGMKASHLRYAGNAFARPLLLAREVATVLGAAP